MCPACNNNLSSVQLGGITVDVCKNGCGGIWFDRFELSKVDEKAEQAGELLSVPTNPTTKIDQSVRLKCPKDGAILMRHFFSAKRRITADECPKCAGYWLDAGELRGIRDEFDTEADRVKAANEYFDKEFGTQMQKMRSESQEKLAKAQHFARMLRFICPSNYIPGKQKGGAF